jgi:hypothetical protein
VARCAKRRTNEVQVQGFRVLEHALFLRVYPGCRHQWSAVRENKKCADDLPTHPNPLPVGEGGFNCHLDK